MTTTMGSLDLNTFSNLYNDATQYFWFESDSTATYGAGVHITLSPSATFMSNPTGQNILINTDGISIRNGLLPMMTLDNDSLDFNVIDTLNNTFTNVASFGATSTIGVTSGTQSYMQYDYHSIQLKDKEGNNYFYVSDLRNASGLATWTDTFIGNGVDEHFSLLLEASNTAYTVSVSDNSGGTVTKRTGYFYFSSAPTNGATITATYTTESQFAKAYTLGLRDNSGVVAPMSVAEGGSTIASGYASHASGDSTIASEYASFAMGRWNDNTTLHASVPSGTIFDLDGEPAAFRYPLLWIGNGTDPSFDFGGRSNALTLDSVGNLAIGWKLTMCGHSSPIGTTMRDNFTASLTSGTSLQQVYPSTGKINMPAGSWIINYSTRFPSNTTGRRGASIYINDGSMGASYSLATPVSGEQTALTGSIVYESPSSSFTLGFGARQNSGSTQTITVYWDAIRIA